METDLTRMGKWRRIYGADRWVMHPDCDHGAALVTGGSGIIDIVDNCVCGVKIQGGVGRAELILKIHYLHSVLLLLS